MVKKTVLILLFVVLFAACSRSEELAHPSTQAAVIVTETIMTPLPTNTQTAVPTSSSTPNPIDTPTPTATPTPMPTAAIWVEAGTPVAAAEVIGLENVGQITELARWGRGVIRDIDLSEEGRWLAVASGSGVYIHDLQDFAAKPLAIETDGNVTAVSISPIGDKVAFVTREAQLQLWQVDPMEQLFVADGVQKVQFSPDGEVLAITTHIHRGSLELWDVDDGTVFSSYRLRYGFDPRIKFSPNGSQVAIWSQNDDMVEVYDWQEDILAYKNEAVLHRETDEEYYDPMVSDIAFLTEDDLRFLVIEIRGATFLSGRIEVQEAKDNTLLFSADSIGYHGFYPERACNESSYLADLPDPYIPTQMGVSSDSQIVALYYRDSSLRFHRAAGGNQPYFIEEGVVDFEFAPDGQTWVTGLQDGRLQIRQLNDGAVLESVDAYESPILNTIISPDDTWVGVIHTDEVKVYERADGTLRYRYPAAAKIAFAPDGESFTLAYQDGQLELYDINSGERIKSVMGHEDRVTALNYLPTGELLSAGADCNIIIWEMPTMIPTDSLENILVKPTLWEDEEDEKVAVHIQEFLVMPDGQSVIGQFYDFGVWEMEEGQLIRTPSSDYQEYSNVLATSSDGRTLAVPSQRIPESWDDDIRLIGVDARLGDFSPDTNLFVGGQWEYYATVGELNFWQVSSPTQPLHSVETKIGEVRAVVFTQDGQMIVSGGQDGIVRLWGIPTGR